MKNLFLSSLSVMAIFALTAFTFDYATSWNISDDYSIKFSGRGANGTFTGLQGTIHFAEDDLAAANMNVSVDVNSIDTGNKTKDKHARGESWFYAEKYPRIQFKSNKFTPTDAGYTVQGDLTMRGVTKSVTIPFDFKRTNNGGEFTGEVTINREDFGIEGPFFSFTVSDEFLVELKVPVQIKG